MPKPEDGKEIGVLEPGDDEDLGCTLTPIFDGEQIHMQLFSGKLDADTYLNVREAVKIGEALIKLAGELTI